MKITIRIAVFILIAGLVFSCDKWMDLIPPTGLVRDEFWKSKEDVEAVVMGAYAAFSKMDGKLWLYGEMRGDMVIGDYNQDWNEQQIQDGNIYPTNWLCNWQDFYAVINYCNEVIKNAPIVRGIDDTFTDFQMQGFLAEAHFLRSLSYFYLIRLYKDVPYITIPTETDDSDIYVEKIDGESILDSLIIDLVEYRKYITIDGYRSEEDNKGRATKAAFDALLADIYLWRFDYENVLTYCANIEANDDYLLVESGDWFTIFSEGNSFEGIFEFQFDAERAQENNLYELTRQNSHKYDPSQTAIEWFSREASDLEIFRGQDASIRMIGEDDYTIWKYEGFAADGETVRFGAVQKSANFIIYRLADIKLMKAEALSQLGRLLEAEEVINEVRTARGMSGVKIESYTKSGLEDKVMDERTLELAFEGKRWFDLMRMGRRNDFARKDKVIEIIVTNVSSTQKRILASKLNNPLSWYLPIYDGELQRNKNLVQNPFYKD